MRAFTLIELIFVIIIVGILSIGAINAIPDNTLINNTNYIYNKILEKKANSIEFMANMQNDDEKREVCITFNKNWLKNDETNAKVKFNISKRVVLKSDVDTICFDYLGRPYDGLVDLETFDNLLHKDVNVSIKYHNKQKIITIYHMTGDIEIQ
jgi:prepilin-type N-terminal cleavage/methylation domain-containing protein